MTGEAENLSPAKQAARQAQERVDACLADGQNFRLEAGAGAGKTYSLVAALKKLIAERGADLMHAGQRVACITYTEVARNEIATEIEAHPAILVDTIHGFGWGFISQFQKKLRELVQAQESRQEAIDAAGGINNQRVEYSFGFFGIDEKRITLHHDDVPLFLSQMLEIKKFRQIFQNLFPVVFIDEYQDTDQAFMEALSKHFFAGESGPSIGLFGDHWQTIYRKEYQFVDFPGIEGIDKQSNFRSVPAVVNVLNRLRPELQQFVDDEEAVGEARFFHCNSFDGERISTAHAKNDLPPDIAAAWIGHLRAKLEGEGWNFDPAKTKILMLTHNAIAADRGYPNLAKIFDRNEAFAKKEDATIAFLADIVEPVCVAYEAGKFGSIFQLMGGRPVIKSVADKAGWKHDLDGLLHLRAEGTIGEVLDHLRVSQRPRVSDRVAAREAEIAQLGPEETEDEPNSLKRHRRLRNVAYKELACLVDFINGYTPFATQHSVKGAEFENVLVILSGGWNHYNWPKFLELRAAATIAAKDQGGFYRVRNLLYVALSRPKVRLAVLATQTLSDAALGTANQLFGAEHVFAL